MQGMSQRQYAAHVGLSRGAIERDIAAGRIVFFEDGSIDAAASDELFAKVADPTDGRSKPRKPQTKAVPYEALAAVSDTLREQGLKAPEVGEGTTFLQAKTANEVLKAQERRIRLLKLKGDLIDKAKALLLVFKLARDLRDAWVNWPARSAGMMAAELGVEPGAMQRVLDKYVRAHLEEIADVKPDFR